MLKNYTFTLHHSLVVEAAIGVELRTIREIPIDSNWLTIWCVTIRRGT